MRVPNSTLRQTVVKDLIEKTRLHLDSGELDRAALLTIKADLDALAENRKLWTEDEFADPAPDEQQNRYLIDGEDNDGISLYLNVMRPGKKIPPHNHTTWACIAAVEGVEHNTLYDRVDDGSVDGVAEIKEREVVALAPGNSLAMMADDIHSVDILGEKIIRHLHFYGQSLESLKGRKKYDMSNGTYQIMDIGVKSKR